MKTVSVIIPCYKDAATLARALDSVYAQTHMVDEVIVVNDDSPQTSAIESVLNEFPRVKYLVNTRNMGLAATRNIGVQAANGDVVCFLDADDELHPQKIEMQWSIFQPERAISCNVMRIGDERGIERSVPFHGLAPYKQYSDSAQLVRRNTLTGASLMIARQLFLEQGGYDETLRSCEDWDLWLRLRDAGVSVFNIEWPLYFYRVNEQGLSRNLLNISHWELEVVKKHYARQKTRGKRCSDEGPTLALWLFRHFVRYERCRDPQLLRAIRENLALLDEWPNTRRGLKLAQIVGLPRLVGYLLASRQ